jgi:hypothetical protein
MPMTESFSGQMYGLNRPIYCRFVLIVFCLFVCLFVSDVDDLLLKCHVVFPMPVARPFALASPGRVTVARGVSALLVCALYC